MIERHSRVWLCPSAKERWNPCSQPPPVYQDLGMHHDWPVKKSIVILPIRLKGNLKRNSSNLLSPLGTQNKDISTALQTLLTGVRSHLQRRLLLGFGCNFGIPEKCIFQCILCNQGKDSSLKICTFFNRNLLHFVLFVSPTKALSSSTAFCLIKTIVLATIFFVFVFVLFLLVVEYWTPSTTRE